jgi:hypothetical protein
VFIASILVPFTKVLVMLTLLLSIHFRCEPGTQRDNAGENSVFAPRSVEIDDGDRHQIGRD